MNLPSEERQEKKAENNDKDTEYDKLLEELNAGGLDLTRVSKKLTPYGPMWWTNENGSDHNIGQMASLWVFTVSSSQNL